MFYEMNYPMPVCCPHPDVNEYNMGWSMGVIEDGVPFVAELWGNEDEDKLGVMFYLPYMERLLPGWSCVVTAIDLPEEDENYDNSKLIVREEYFALLNGMTSLDDQLSLEYIQAYIGYLKQAELLMFTDIYENGSLHVCLDWANRPIVGVSVVLSVDDEEAAITPLDFMDFNKWKGGVVCAEGKNI